MKTFLRRSFVAANNLTQFGVNAQVILFMRIVKGEHLVGEWV